VAITRVYLLARELGVSSTAIMKKCHDEGLDINNHMAVVSAGLAATIKEWFSEGDNVTAVETTEKVNLEKVRVKKRKAQIPPQTPPVEPPVLEQPPAVVEPQPQPIVAEPVEAISQAAPPVVEAPPVIETPAPPPPPLCAE